MIRRTLSTLLLAAIACGVKAPPRPPEPESAPVADGGAADAGKPTPTSPAGGCAEGDGGCGR